MVLETVAAWASTLAQWLLLRKQRRDTESQINVEAYKDWLRRQEHADLAARLDQNATLLQRVTELIEDQSLESATDQHELEQTIKRRLTVAIGRLPITGPNLFGRKQILGSLSRIWNNTAINVVSIVAAGGVGKSALVNHWLNRLSAKGWRGARRVYGHSFYSQGTRHETASADAFVDEALRWFGDEPRAEDRRSPWAKGERLADLVRAERTLLILDGMEPLQLPPGPNGGHVNDPALQALLCGLAADNPGLCIVTTRVHVGDLERYPMTTRLIDLETLPPEAGAELLRSLGVQGPDNESLQASADFGHHALALTLLGKYLAKAHSGDVRKSREIKLPEAAVNVVGDHARNMMAWYEKWFAQNGRQAEVSILRMLGLFNRPAEKGCIAALRAEPTIAQLTDSVVGISEADWNMALSNLREVGLLARSDARDADAALDCHPLVREHFGEALHKHHPEAWRAGHERLYEYLKGRGCAKEYPDTLAEMQPLFAAVTHGCAAGQHQQTLDDVYWRRISRGKEAYAVFKLGAFGADLGALANFFEEPWCRPVGGLSARDRAFAMSEVGFRLRALGRGREAIAPLEVALRERIEGANWLGASVTGMNLAELLLALGHIEKALGHCRRAIADSDQSSDAFRRLCSRTCLAHALHQGGRASEAEDLFREAESMQGKLQPDSPLLYSMQGF